MSRQTQSPEALLADLAADPTVADGVEDAEVVETHTEDVTVIAESTLTVSETAAKRRVPRSEYESMCTRHVSYVDRYDTGPEEFADERVEFVTTDEPVTDCPTCGGETTNPCPDCGGDGEETCSICAGSENVECPDCHGSGEEACRSCRGTGTQREEKADSCPRCNARGTIECPDCAGEEPNCGRCGGEARVNCPDCDGDGTVTVTETVTCPACSGTETQPCTTCDGSEAVPCSTCEGTGTTDCGGCGGDGKITCGLCDGEGETAEPTVGRLEFSAETTLSTDSDRIPADLFEPGDGTSLGTEREDPERRPTDSDPALYRRRTETSEAACTHVVYSYRGDRYEVASVDGTLRYTDYPRSGDYLREQVEGARDDDTFEYGDATTVTAALAAAPTRLFRDALQIGAGTVVLALVVVVLGLPVTLLSPLGAGVNDAVVLGAGALAGLALAARWDDPAATSTTSSTLGGGLGAPLALVALAVALVALNAVPRPAQLALAAAAAALWSARVADRLTFEGERVAHAKTQRRQFLDTELDGGAEDLAEHDLDHLLPDADAAADRDGFARASTAVFVFGWGLSVYYLGVLALSTAGDSFLLLDYLDFTQAVAVPFALFGVTAAAWVLMWFRRL